MIKVLIADDHAIYRDGLRAVLMEAPGIDLIGEATNGSELIALVQEKKPDVILTDIRMPVLDGITATLEIIFQFPTIRILILSMLDDESQIMHALESGAFGYLTKNARKSEIIEAITTVYNNQPYYSMHTSATLARSIRKNGFNPYEYPLQSQFSLREKAVIRLICEGLISQEIADILNLGKRSVEQIRRNILAKMQVKTPSGIAIYALKHGLFGDSRT